jgi:hypothetical protein
MAAVRDSPALASQRHARSTGNSLPKRGRTSTQPDVRRFRLNGMRKVLMIASGMLWGLLVIVSCEPAWLYLTAEGSGITGETIVGPTCPVVRAGEVCPPGYIAMWAIVTRSGWPGVAAVVHAGADGRFRVQLPPGLYTLHVLQSPWHPPLPRLIQSTITVRVRANAYTPVTVDFDSGLR